MSSGPADDAVDVENCIDMLTLCDTLQRGGVDSAQANRYVASLIRTKHKPTVTEVDGRSNIIKMANDELRNLNVTELKAMDLRTLKPSGQPWEGV